MKRSGIVILVLVIIFGCSKATKNEQNSNNYFIVESREIVSFPVPDSIMPFAYKTQFFDNEINPSLNVLFWNNVFVQYDWNRSTIKRLVKYDEKGNNGIGKSSGFMQVDSATILINSEWEPKLSVINMNGSVEKVFRFDSDSIRVSPATMKQGLSCLLYHKDTLIVPQFQTGWVFDKTKEELNAYKTFLKYDMVNNTFKKAGMSLPYINSDHKYRDRYFSLTKSKNCYVLSFNSYNEVFVTRDFENFEPKLCQSKHVIGVPGKMLKTQDVNKVLLSCIKNNRYCDMVWDEFREVYYRFYKVGSNEIDKNANIYEMNHYSDQLGIMVIDKDFNVLVDQLLTLSRYYFNNYFITPKGLYLSINHPNNEDFDVNKLQFELLKFEKNE